MTPIDRRSFLQTVAAGAAMPFLMGADEAGPDLIVRSSYPLDAETPVEVFDRFLTPNRLFFVRSHFGPPAIGLSPWRLEVDGLVDRALSMGLDDLKGFEQVTMPAVLQCSGNGRAYFEPKIPGVGWEKGAVGNAEWSGVRLVDVLEKAGIQADAAHVQLHGADTPPNPKTPAFFRSIPLARAIDRSTILATTMNGEPLPNLHGGPIRLVVPGWAGNHWIKWLRKVTVAKDEAPGFYMQTGYKMPKVPTAPGVDLKPTDLKSVTTLNVKSLIARPTDGAVLTAGRVEVKGVAWTGDGVVERVEVSTLDGVWSPATLIGDPRSGTWRSWTFAWDAKPGRYSLKVRAVDSKGETQPEVSPWNRSGYLWNGIDRVSCEVR